MVMRRGGRMKSKRHDHQRQEQEKENGRTMTIELHTLPHSFLTHSAPSPKQDKIEKWNHLQLFRSNPHQRSMNLMQPNQLPVQIPLPRSDNQPALSKTRPKRSRHTSQRGEKSLIHHISNSNRDKKGDKVVRYKCIGYGVQRR